MCGKVSHDRPRPHRHLMGGTQNGGHEMSEGGHHCGQDRRRERVEVPQRSSPTAVLDHSRPGAHYTTVLAARLVAKASPECRFERIIDGFLGMFLADIVKNQQTR